jgi:Mor family transcriptional regulator
MTDLIDDKGKRNTVYPHKALALAFIKNSFPRKQKIVIHIDGDISNNSLENLRWSSYSESIRIGFETGKRDNSTLWLKRRLKYGPKGGNKSMGRPDPLDYGKKKRIKYLRDEKGFTLQQLATKYKCSVSHIHKTLKTFVAEEA